jgi:hypothetical protein
MSAFQGTLHMYHTMLQTMSVIFSSSSFMCPTYSTVLLRDGRPEHSTLLTDYNPVLNLETCLTSHYALCCESKLLYLVGFCNSSAHWHFSAVQIAGDTTHSLTSQCVWPEWWMLQLSKDQQVTELVLVYQHTPVKFFTNCGSAILHPA